MNRCRVVVVTVLAAMIVLSPPARAAKTDTVVLVNGNVITGEIKSLNRSILTYSTDPMEIVSVKWIWVAELRSDSGFVVTLTDGTQLFGPLQAGTDPRSLKFRTPIQEVEVLLSEVVRIERVEKSFLDRLDLSLNAGYTYTQASALSQLPLDGRVTYRDRLNYSEFSFDSILTNPAGDTLASGQFDVSAGYQRTLSGRLFAGGSVSGQRNDELGLDLRLLATMGAGYRFIETNVNILKVGGGLSLNQERSTQGGGFNGNVEAAFQAGYSLFISESPETDLEVTLGFFDNVNNARIRYDLDADLRRELFKDFFVTATFYQSYDSIPPDDTGQTHDRGLVLKLGWTK